MVAVIVDRFAAAAAVHTYLDAHSIGLAAACSNVGLSSAFPWACAERRSQAALVGLALAEADSDLFVAHRRLVFFCLFR